MKLLVRCNVSVRRGWCLTCKVAHIGKLTSEPHPVVIVRYSIEDKNEPSTIKPCSTIQCVL